ncbi:MAG: hypothetical protein KatS3mg130_1313 [Candidatus Sumerlaea sp.]|nr:MAG: hypothetical protein KatS3mg130_1313 [Candidatus Sumerlaea sp.]
MRTKLQQRRASTRLSRRKFLQFVGLGALAGCSSSTWAWLWSQASIRDATQDNPGGVQARRA